MAPFSFHRFARARGPVCLLLALLQRSPAVQAVADLVGSAFEAPVASLVRASVTSLAALGVVDALAGATAYSLSTGVPGHPSPYTVVEGSQIEAVAFALDAVPQTANPPESWTVSGSIPPGLELGAQGNFITAAGVVNVAMPILEGTPTTPGDYTMVLQAWEYTGGTGQFSSSFTYEVIVTSGQAPTPTPTPTPSGLAPVFTTQPISVSVGGGTVALDAVASHAPTYQWMLSGVTPVAGATSPTLLLSNAASSLGTYTCVATNTSGSATSAPATVGLAGPANPGRLINLSARAQVGTGGNIIFAGFVVGGSGTLPLLIRASGPAIAVPPFSVPGTLPDPQLQLFNGSALINTNNGWLGNAGIIATAKAVGAFAWNTPSSHDSALNLSLSAGPFAYTAQVAGQTGDTGDALVEVYDATPAGAFTSASPKLVNLAARVDVGTGGNALFAGFVIGGSSAVTVLLRASGPAIAAAPFNVPGTLPDPQLTLQNQAGAVLATNASWGGNPEIAATAAAVGAFGWNVPTSHDSALLITLPPGAYTAAAVGSSGDSGVAIVEVYEVP
jgi:hypothetical protein